jgi:hypothetical protein
LTVAITCPPEGSTYCEVGAEAGREAVAEVGAEVGPEAGLVAPDGTGLVIGMAGPAATAVPPDAANAQDTRTVVTIAANVFMVSSNLVV